VVAAAGRVALAALEPAQSRPRESALFPSPRGGSFDTHNFRNVLENPPKRGGHRAAAPRLRSPHKFATFASVPASQPSTSIRYMGAV